MTKSDRRARPGLFPALACCACLALSLFSPPVRAQTAARHGPVAARLPTVRIGGLPYLSLADLADRLQGRLRPNPLKKKAVLVVGGHTLVLTLFSPVVVLDDVAYRLPREAVFHDGAALHAPADAFLGLLRHAAPDLPEVAVEPPPEPEPPPPVAAARPAPSPEPVRQPEADPARWALDTVIIDPGHGGKDPGAIGRRGTKEKEIVLQVAGRLKDLLEKQLRVRAVLTRNDDTFLPLHERARIARQSGGKLFVSLHCNAGKNDNASGVEVYFLSEARTAEAAEVARRENAVVRFEEDADSAATEIEGIQFGLLSTQWLKESQDLAATVRAEIGQTVPGLADRGVRQANFYVMRGTMGDMPSILIEIGFISNAAEEKRLRSRAFQKAMAEAVFRGIKTFKRRYERQLTTNR